LRPIGFTVRPTTDEEINSNMPYVTSSMIEAIQTCPRWGLIRNVQRRYFTSHYRQMALEAGSLMHDVMAAYHLLALACREGLVDHAMYHGNLLLGPHRWEGIPFTECVTQGEPAMDKLALAVIATSDFHDDPYDKNRTLSNLEICASYLGQAFATQHWSFPIYVADRTDPTAPIGIEVSLDVVFEVRMEDDTLRLVRFIGLADALYQNPDTSLVKLGEFKTSSRMNDSWQEAFRTRHQITAYAGALEALFPLDQLTYETILTGLHIPVRSTQAATMTFPVHRDREHVLSFLNSALFCFDLMAMYQDELALEAPMFTHSCNRYFRPCGFLDLCDSSYEDQRVMYAEMEPSTSLSPSEERALMRKE
jgi:hypothetical protein